jgi:lipopolysaccharide transport system ATP-binding protein
LRLAFAVAAHFEPEILLLDEVLAVGDASFQKKCLQKMKEVNLQGRTIFFVSHDLMAVQQICSRVILLENSEVYAQGEPISMVLKYVELMEKTENNV